MKKFLNKKNFIILISGSILIFILTVLLIPVEIKPDPAIFSRVVLDKDGEMLRVFLNREEQWVYPDTGTPVPEKLKTCVLVFEDKRFYSHFGVDPVAVLRAAYLNIRNGRVVSGGSTLTMQLARIKNRKSRTYFNKLTEMFQSVKLELYLDKDEILRQYLLLAPYGRNIIGYQTASYKYFGKPADQLSWSESALLAILPNSPGQLAPGINQGRLVQKRNGLLLKLKDEGFIDGETLRISTAEKIIIIPNDFPKEAPHASEYLVRKSDENIIRSTIDKKIQNETEEIVKRHSVYLQNYGIDNMAVLVAETGSGKVRAYVGSQDFWDNSKNGKVDGVLASRSSGSVLKPFLYAKAVDEGLICEASLLEDVPVNISNFSPMNADDKFSGLVTVKEALTRSLNVPAVMLLKRYGLYHFYAFLKDAGVSTLFRSPDDYGLSLIIGGAEVSLRDMVSLFRGLGNYGEFGDLELEENTYEEKKVTKQLISKGASYIVLKMLEDVNRPGIEYFWNLFENSRPVSWKTGTSYGHKDAWALGVTTEWTVGVWCGNFTGDGNKSLGGAKSAGPVLFDIFNSISTDKYEPFYAPVNEIRFADVCSMTGYAPSDCCTGTVSVLLPKNSAPLSLCPYHDRIHISADGKEQVCSLCWDDGHKEKTVLRYPPLVARTLRKAGAAVDGIPEHRRSCPSQQGNTEMNIIYPVSGSKVYIPTDIGGVTQRIKLDVAHAQKAAKVFWYIDGIYYGITENEHSRSVNLESGIHTLKVIDMNGIDRQVSFEVLRSR